MQLYHISSGRKPLFVTGHGILYEIFVSDLRVSVDWRLTEVDSS